MPLYRKQQLIPDISKNFKYLYVFLNTRQDFGLSPAQKIPLKARNNIQSVERNQNNKH